MGERVPRLAPNFSGFVIDPTKCNDLSLEAKRELVHEISLNADNASEILQSWSRRELLQLICAEMGKERKYTGLTKPKMIARLLRLVVQKKLGEKNNGIIATPFSAKSQSGPKKKRRKEHPLLFAMDSDYDPAGNTQEERNGAVICPNLACRAILTAEDVFCRRCSCCICYQYDDNKDPSLWLVCNSDPPYQSNSCGMTCHLNCALKHEKAGIAKNGCYTKLDGCFYCVRCGKVNDLVGSWRKQLLIAKDARRVDVMCHRISLSNKLLKGTERYKELKTIVNTALKKLKKEVGPVDKVSAKMARGIVNRLSCGAEIQKLCAFAVEVVDSMLSGASEPIPHPDLKNPVGTGNPTCCIHIEDVSPVSVVVSLESDDKVFDDVIMGYRLWHRSSAVMEYSEEPTCLVLRPERRIMISGLSPSTEYYFKVSPFTSTRELGKHEARWVTRTSHGSNSHFSARCSDGKHVHEGSVSSLYDQDMGEQPVIIQADSQRGSTNSSDNNQAAKVPKSSHRSGSKVLSLEDISDNNERRLPPPADDVPFVCSNSVPIETPSRSDGPSNLPDSGNQKESAEREYEYCVKVIRWLECEGHMEKEIRVKFLTWFSLKATVQERRIVKAFIDVLIDEPESLVDQLIDAFMDGIHGMKKPALQNGFCTRLWH